jgi:hypothetical protein
VGSNVINKCGKVINQNVNAIYQKLLVAMFMHCKVFDHSIHAWVNMFVACNKMNLHKKHGSIDNIHGQYT